MTSANAKIASDLGASVIVTHRHGTGREFGSRATGRQAYLQLTSPCLQLPVDQLEQVEAYRCQSSPPRVGSNDVDACPTGGDWRTSRPVVAHHTHHRDANGGGLYCLQRVSCTAQRAPLSSPSEALCTGTGPYALSPQPPSPTSSKGGHTAHYLPPTRHPFDTPDLDAPHTPTPTPAHALRNACNASAPLCKYDSSFSDFRHRTCLNHNHTLALVALRRDTRLGSALAMSRCSRWGSTSAP
jgi:hypothetical protein